MRLSVLCSPLSDFKKERETKTAASRPCGL
jgi:hypothetical protein